jgi:hypothetical protein
MDFCGRIHFAVECRKECIAKTHVQSLRLGDQNGQKNYKVEGQSESEGYKGYRGSSEAAKWDDTYHADTGACRYCERMCIPGSVQCAITRRCTVTD